MHCLGARSRDSELRPLCVRPEKIDDVEALFARCADSGVQAFAAFRLFSELDAEHQGVGAIVIPACVTEVEVSELAGAEGACCADGDDEDVAQVCEAGDWSHERSFYVAG